MIDYAINAVTYVVAFLIALLILMNTYSFKKGVAQGIIYGIVAYAVNYVVFILPFSDAYINTIVFFVVNLIWIHLAFDTSLKSLVAISVVLTVLMASTDFLGMYVASLFLKVDVSQYSTDRNFFIIFAIFGKILYFALGLIISQISKSLKSNKDTRIKTPIYIFIYPICALFVLFVFWEISVNNELANKSKIYMSVSGVVVLLSTIITYAFYTYTAKKEREYNTLKNEMNKIKINETYYKLLDYQSDNIKRLAHDEKNHLLMVKGLANNPEVDKYVDKIYSDLQKYSTKGATNNKLLDCLLNKYVIQCEAENITFTTNIRTANLSFMQDADLISLLSNILDNAVESAVNSVDRSIDLSINIALGTTAMTCINSCDTAPENADENLITSKLNKSFHGYGTKIIRQIVKKYGGEYTWRYDEEKKEFVSVIAFT